ncbi:hypothetical protein Ssi03_46850 [Sphaerisporangium siamense]|uniref:Uncharacterized protein n=2 Tax=Sphaerisporangium siamense TaxID=795645 RepID=A0A7W7D2R8_9ACTN|nr:hypothetical protein [Sphaerisporangium siamense]GII86695.1 hypothetical protein Ssi03_46850 [Sphaerisporangium siamense]
MQVEPRMSTWAAERFGARAADVRQRLATSLREAAENAQDAQKWSRSDKRYAYGSTLMARRYEALVAGFRDEPGFQVIRPYRSPHHLVVLDGNLFLPFRFAEDDFTPVSEARVSDGRVSALARELFTRYGPRTIYQQQELDLGVLEDEDEAEDVLPLLRRLPADTRLIPVAYAANARAGLLRLYWGEAELIDDRGHIYWLHCEPIPLRESSPWVPQALPLGSPAARFDAAAEPGLDLAHRSALDRALSAVDTEPPNTRPAAADDHA